MLAKLQTKAIVSLGILLVLFLGYQYLSYLHAKIDKQKIEIGRLISEKDALSAGVTKCNSSIETLQKQGELATKQIEKAMINANSAAKVFEKNAQLILIRESKGASDCEKAADVIDTYLEGLK